MSVTTFVSSKTVQQLKQIAKQYKRRLSIPHTEALELATQKAGFANRHQDIITTIGSGLSEDRHRLYHQSALRKTGLNSTSICVKRFQ